jgi:hypothetical protein
MAKIYSQLEKAQLENRSTDGTAGTIGLIWFNTVSKKAILDDGTLVRALLRNDQNCVLGNDATAANNIRFHRAGTNILQVVKGNDATAEGTLSTNLAKISFCFESYTNASKPTVGNAGRAIWVSDKNNIQVDSGTAWLQVGSGGGGGSLFWVEDGISPFSMVANNTQVYAFSAGDAQNLYTLIRVPSNYVSGTQIKIKLSAYSADTTGTMLIQTQTTLIRTGTDAMTSTTNQRTSTNSAITLSGSTVNIPQEVVFDLTDSSGQINAVAVTAGDFIKIKLTRGTDTATGNVFVPVYGAEATFV